MKSGIDWFPLDVSLDEKFELIEAVSEDIWAARLLL